MTNDYVCEYCGYSEKYGSDIGQDPGPVVRARIVRHEQRCPKNPLVATIIRIRELLISTRILPSQVELFLKLKTAIRETYDCFLDVEVEIEKNSKKESGFDD